MIQEEEPQAGTTNRVRFVVWYFGLSRTGAGPILWRTWKAYDYGPAKARKDALQEARHQQPDSWPQPLRWKVMRTTTITTMQETTHHV